MSNPIIGKKYRQFSGTSDSGIFTIVSFPMYNHSTRHWEVAVLKYNGVIIIVRVDSLDWPVEDKTG